MKFPISLARAFGSAFGFLQARGRGAELSSMNVFSIDWVLYVRYGTRTANSHRLVESSSPHQQGGLENCQGLGRVWGVWGCNTYLLTDQDRQTEQTAARWQLEMEQPEQRARERGNKLASAKRLNRTGGEIMPPPHT